MHYYKRWVIFTAAVFLLISAALVNLPHLYYMAALLLVLPISSYVVGMFALRDLEFSRETPGTGWEGEVVIFHTVVNSRARMPRLFVRTWDIMPEWLAPTDEEPPLFNVAPNGATRIPYQVELRKRGAYTIEGMAVTATDPLGIYAFTKRLPIQSELLVYPVPQELAELDLSGSERYGFRDLPIAATRGSGIDPDGVREYVPGDPLRRMHWKSTARTGKLSVIEFEESRAVNVVMTLDLHQGSDVGEGLDTTLEYLVRAAASIAQLGVRQGAAVRLVMSDAPDAADFAGRGSEHLYTILGSLAKAQAVDPSLLSTRLVSRVGNLAPGTSLIVLTSTIDKELAGALAHYTSGGTQVMLLYAEPRSFLPGIRIPTAEAQQSFLESLYAAQVVPFILRRNDLRRVNLEQISDVRLHS
jgi:uncharacterized protein (DUF58 family)